ncbi:MAG: protein translocase subunit SecD [Patescibacteria group bacterium]|nr:protein translocase subunit SecD [Patescibacteria group bacterium]
MGKRAWLIGVIVVVLVGALIVDLPGFAKLLGISADFRVRQGLDLQGGTHLVYETDLSKVEAGGEADAATGVVEVIRRRIDALGVTEPTIQKTQDNSRVIVELPGVQNVDEAIALIGETAQLEFREGVAGKSLDDNGDMTSANYDDWGDVGLTGANFVKAEVQFAQGSTALVQEPQIQITFDDEGRKIFAEVTGRNVGKPLAIFLDKELLSAPNVNEKIDSDSAVISGNFDLQSAKSLAIQLNAGALPVPIKLISQSNIGATLGTESVQKSITAGLLGLLLVVLFMIIYYRLPGVIASVALVIYALIAMAIFIAVPVTLTLAGIAGFILSIGMAIDANILIFERMKEELRDGAPLQSAIDAGFKRAWSSIRDSNISSLITAIILYYFGSSLIRGFAITLGVGILVSLFSALTVTQTILKLIASTGLKNNLVLWGLGSKGLKGRERVGGAI